MKSSSGCAQYRLPTAAPPASANRKVSPRLIPRPAGRGRPVAASVSAFDDGVGRSGSGIIRTPRTRHRASHTGSGNRPGATRAGRWSTRIRSPAHGSAREVTVRPWNRGTPCWSSWEPALPWSSRTSPSCPSGSRPPPTPRAPRWGRSPRPRKRYWPQPAPTGSPTPTSAPRPSRSTRRPTRRAGRPVATSPSTSSGSGCHRSRPRPPSSMPWPVQPGTPCGWAASRSPPPISPARGSRPRPTRSPTPATGLRHWPGPRGSGSGRCCPSWEEPASDHGGFRMAAGLGFASGGAHVPIQAGTDDVEARLTITFRIEPDQTASTTPG